MEVQKTSNSQSYLEKEDGTGGINLPDFRLYYKATVIKYILYHSLPFTLNYSATM